VARKRIFISYDYENDAHYKNLLVAWSSNSDFDLQVYDTSVKVGINSTNAYYIKSKITPMITWASYLLCVIGEQTYQSDWVDWEIRTAIKNGKRLIAVKINKDCVAPVAIISQRATWALSFNFAAVKKAIDEA
jgi:hypothetical protein